MIQPDSGKRCCDLADKGHRAGCPGKPDSGEREVRCTAPFAWSDGMVQCELPRGHDGRHDAARRVILPLSLAQRILAALEWRGQWRQRNELAAELRAIVERKT